MATALLTLCGTSSHLYGVGRIHPSAPAARVAAPLLLTRPRNHYRELGCEPDDESQIDPARIQACIAGACAPQRAAWRSEAAVIAQLAAMELGLPAAKWVYWTDPALPVGDSPSAITQVVADGETSTGILVSQHPIRPRRVMADHLAPCTTDAIGRFLIDLAVGHGRPVILESVIHDRQYAILHRDPRGDRVAPYRVSIIDAHGPIGHFSPHPGESTEAFLGGYVLRGWSRLHLSGIVL